MTTKALLRIANIVNNFLFPWKNINSLLRKNIELLSKQSDDLLKQSTEWDHMVKELMPYYQLGHMLILNQFFEESLKQYIIIQYNSLQRPPPSDLDKPLGPLITILKNITPQSVASKNIFEKLEEYRIKRNQYTHNVFKINKSSPEKFDLFFNNIMNDKDTEKLLKELGTDALDIVRLLDDYFKTYKADRLEVSVIGK